MENGKFCVPDICRADHSSYPPSRLCRTDWLHTEDKTYGPNTLFFKIENFFTVLSLPLVV